MIDRRKLSESFERYIGGYDPSDERIALKVLHTHKVAENCDALSEGLGLTDRDRDLAWAIGMLHDIGRFEQVARTGSFIDSAASDHASAGVDYLFGRGAVRNFIEDLSEEDTGIIRTAIAQHNRHVLPDDLTGRELMHCRIIRDADKLDIFRVCLENSFEVAHEYPAEVVRNSEVSQAVIECFEKTETLDYSKRKQPADIFLGHIAMCFGLYYPFSRNLAASQGYIARMMDFTFADPDMQKKFERMKEQTERFLNCNK